MFLVEIFTLPISDVNSAAMRGCQYTMVTSCCMSFNAIGRYNNVRYTYAVKES